MPHKIVPPLYWVWHSMKQRCENPNLKAWKDYGGRGITFCERWRVYANFEADMQPKPPGMTLDRIDNEKDYSPENCRWATRKEQQRNRRIAVWVEIEGKKYRAIELADISGHKADTIIERAFAGLPYDLVISKDRHLSLRKPVEAIAARRANSAARTHCSNGHPWTPENTRITPQGWRNCRVCHREKMRQRSAEARMLKANAVG